MASAAPKKLLDFDLERCDRIYRDGDICRGTVTFNTDKSISHSGVVLSVWGVVKLTLNPSSVGLLETFYSSIKPQELMRQTITIAKPGKIPRGESVLNFELNIKPLPGQVLHPTFHGVYITIAYGMKVEFESTGWSGKKLNQEIEFIMDCKPLKGRTKGNPIAFEITPSSLENVQKSVMQNLPLFHFVGKVTNARCPINSPFTGEIEIKDAKAPIRSISLQLVRVETVVFSEGAAKEATEVQNIQIANGDVCRKMVIPIYMIFPRLFTCPTLITDSFKIEFEVNLIVLFEDSHMITENFQLELIK